MCESQFDSEIDVCPEDGSPLVGVHIGRIIDGYAVEAVLGHGTTGTVYCSRRVADDRPIALKILRSAHANKRRSIRRFEREAEAVARMDHPNIVSVVGSGVHDNLFYLAMELLDGETLDVTIARESMIAPERVVRIGRQIALGLAHAHELGFVHRDLKPQNIMRFDEGGEDRVKILDFGLVGFADPEDGGTRVTRDGYMLGTATYMAPEQVGQSSVGPSADLYALGIILYEMLSGAPPFEGSMRQVVLQQMATPPPPIGRFGGLDELVLALLEKDPTERPPDAASVAAELSSYLPSLQPTSIGPAPRVERSRSTKTEAAPVPVRFEAPRPLPWLPVLAVIVGLGLIAFGIGAFSRPSRNQRVTIAPRATPPAVAAVVSAAPDDGAVVAPDAAPAPPAPVETPVAEADAPDAAPHVEASDATSVAPPSLASPKSAAKPRPSRRRPARKTASRSRVPEPRAQLMRVLSSRGLQVRDLDQLEGTTASYRRYRRALRLSDRSEQAAALADLIDAAGRVEVTLGLVRRRLDELSRALEIAHKYSERDDFRKIGDEYLDLSSKVRPGLLPRQYEAQLGLVRQLRARLRAISP